MLRLKHLLPLLAIASSVASAQLIRQANTTLTLPATLPAASGYTTANALGSLTFAAPIAVRSQPGSTSRLFVVERGGTIQLVNLAGNTKSLFFDLATYLNSKGTPLSLEGECGFLSMEFDPHYLTNGYIYVFYSFGNSGLYQRVARFTVNGTPATATSVNTATEVPLFTQLDQAVNHNGGDLHVGPDGYLYISTGDEGSSNNQLDNAGHINKDFFSAICASTSITTARAGREVSLLIRMRRLQPLIRPQSIRAPTGFRRTIRSSARPRIGTTRSPRTRCGRRFGRPVCVTRFALLSTNRLGGFLSATWGRPPTKRSIF